MRLITTILILLLCATSGSAQQFRYIDESGSIHFVDSIYEIPMQYRNQVLKPTPTIVIDKKHRRSNKPIKTPKPTPTVKPTKTPKPTRTPKPTPLSRDELMKRRAPPPTLVVPLARPVASPFVLPERAVPSPTIDPNVNQ